MRAQDAETVDVELRTGSAFKPDFDPARHVYVIASNPAMSPVVAVNFTSTEYVDKKTGERKPRQFADRTCLLNDGDHSSISHETYVYYGKALLLDVSAIEHGIRTGVIEPVDPVSKDVMNRIWEGANVSRQLPNKCREVLAAQKLVQSSPPMAV